MTPDDGTLCRKCLSSLDPDRRASRNFWNSLQKYRSDMNENPSQIELYRAGETWCCDGVGAMRLAGDEISVRFALGFGGDAEEALSDGLRKLKSLGFSRCETLDIIPVGAHRDDHISVLCNVSTDQPASEILEGVDLAV